MITQTISHNRRNGIGDIIPHIVQTACSYRSEITFSIEDKRVNAKSIMGVMALASQNSENLQVSVNGEDEKEAMQAMSALLA